MAQANAGTKDALKTALAAKINSLAGMSGTGITVTAENITVAPFNAATAGDADDSDGTDGSFSFTVALSKGAASDTTAGKNGAITAVYYISSDATLSSLSVTGTDISPAFDPAVNSYTASVENSVSTVTITATAANSRATVSGDTGVKALSVGSNAFTIAVTAENGSRLAYTIAITRAASSGNGGSPDNDNPSGSPGGTVQTQTKPEVPTTGTTLPLTPDQTGGVTVKDDSVSAAISSFGRKSRRSLPERPRLRSVPVRCMTLP